MAIAHRIKVTTVLKTYDTEPVEYLVSLLSIGYGFWFLIIAHMIEKIQFYHVLTFIPAWGWGTCFCTVGLFQLWSIWRNKNNGVKDFTSLVLRLLAALLSIGEWTLLASLFIYGSAGINPSIPLFLLLIGTHLWIYLRIWRLFLPQWVAKVWTKSHSNQ